MKAIRVVICLGLVFAVSLLLLYSSPGARSAEKENDCFTCHTNARKLLKINRESSKVNKGKPGASAVTKAEG